MCKLSQIDSLYRKHNFDRILQGDILRDVKFNYAIHETSIIEYFFPYMVVLSQDCDLEQDFDNRKEDGFDKKHDKYIYSILVCPAYLSEDFRKGEHLKSFDFRMESKNSKQFSDIKINQNPRYHYLEHYPEFQIPSMVLDFKHYFTFNTDYLYYIHKEHYVASLNELFRECLSQRFSYYLSRIGLPNIKSLP
jgi:hypothetical protein